MLMYNAVQSISQLQSSYLILFIYYINKYIL